MIEVIAILLFAFLLIGLEAIVPGGVLGILGFCCIVFSAYQAHLAFGGWFAPMLTFILGSVAAVIIVFVELKWLSKSKIILRAIPKVKRSLTVLSIVKRNDSVKICR